MGYYTYFTCSVHDNKKDAFAGGREAPLLKIKRAAVLLAVDAFDFTEEEAEEKIPGDDPMGYLLEGDSMKWYESDADMLRLSEKCPDLWFRLSGDGEENSDMWYTIFHAGNSTTSQAEIVFPEPRDVWPDE